MATQAYVLDESFEMTGLYNSLAIGDTNPVPAYTAVKEVAKSGGTSGGRCMAVATNADAFGSDSIGLLQEPCTLIGQICRVRTLGISKARITAAAVAANDRVAVASATGQVATITMVGAVDAGGAQRSTHINYVLGKARTLGVGSAADELIEVNVNPIAI